MDAVLDAWTQALMREATRLAGQSLKETVAILPKDAKAAIHATLMALTPEIAARKAGCERKTIDRAITAGKIIAVKGSTGMVILDRRSFDAWALARKPEPSGMSNDVQPIPV
jgi:hypothetical protein